MQVKLFEEIGILKDVNDDIPLEDPNQIHAEGVSSETVVFLNEQTRRMEEDNHRIFTLESLYKVATDVVAMEGLSHTSAGILFVAVDFTLKGTGLVRNSPSLENFVSGNSTIETAYALEDIKEKAKEIGKKIGVKLLEIADVKVDIFRKIWDKGNAQADRAVKNMGFLDRFSDDKKKPSATVKGEMVLFVGDHQSNLNSDIDNAIKLLQNHSLQDAGIECYVELINELRSIKTDNVESFNKSVEVLEENQRGKILKVMESKGFHKVEDRNDKKSEEHDVFQLTFDADSTFSSLVTVTYYKDGLVSNVHSDSIYTGSEKSSDKKEMKLLSKDEIHNYLSKAVDLGHALSKTKRDGKHEKQLIGKYLSEIKRIEGAMHKFNVSFSDDKRYNDIKQYIGSSQAVSKILYKPVDDILEYSSKLLDSVMVLTSMSMSNLKKE